MNRDRDLVDPRIERASTIPSEWYFGADHLEREVDRVFSATWQLAGRLDQLDGEGAYFTTTVGREPVIVVRGRDRTVRALSNVCRHRAGPVTQGEGQRLAFRCGYHGWSYGLDGALLATPDLDGVEGFRKEDHCLPSFRVETWGPLVFVNLDLAAAPLAEFMGDIHERLGNRDLAPYRFVERKEWTIECNWKVYVDNYLEGYHIPIVHPGLMAELDYANYRTETRDWYSIQHSPIRKPKHLRVAAEGEEAQYFRIFPSLMLNVYPDNYSTNLILPLGPDRTLTIFDWFFTDPDAAETRKKLEDTVRFSDEIQIEDIGICEKVQKGLRSRTYRQGRYSPRRENGVHHFHRLLAGAMK
ncbi:MAG: SRPBCC family protein [Thermoanaerobaculia bacterium]